MSSQTMTNQAKNTLVIAVSSGFAVYLAQTGGKLAGRILGVCLATDNPLVAASLGSLGAEVGRATALGALVIIGAYWLVDSLIQFCLDHR
jgi:hypothetical protein